MTAPIDLVGKRFGRLTVIKRSDNDERGSARWVAQCVCGGRWVGKGAHLRRGLTKSCGCLFANGTNNWRHGKSKTRAYKIWCGIIRRCADKTDPDYGGRGIEVCEEWRDFQNFYRDMGNPKPIESINRRDNDGPYSKDNCEWADRKTQARNKRNTKLATFAGVTKPLTQWCEEFGLPYKTVFARINKLDWTLSKALSTAPRECKRRRA